MKAIELIVNNQSIEKELNLDHYEKFSDLLKDQFKEIEKTTVAIQINAKNLLDLSEVIHNHKNIKQLKWIDLKSNEGVDILRHSTTHLMAQAVFRIYNHVKCSHGPTTEYGFFYDFEFENPISEKELEKIELEMHKIVEESIFFERKILKIEEAIDYFKKKNASYKVEILNSIQKESIETVSLYQQGEFIDLCRGPHVPNSSYIKHFKLLKISGVYWKDVRDKMLSRIYGVAFSEQEDLDNHLNYLQELKKRDHRNIGKQLNLFHFDSSIPGFPFWHSKGFSIYKYLEDWIRKENNLRGYKEVRTPIIYDENLWKKTGHYDYFKENMFFLEHHKSDNKNYAIKPMNCPGHALIYNQFLHSYKDLPLRISEFGLVHRNELSGVLYGLFRVRNFTQDDGHIFCKIEDITSEIIKIIQYTLETYRHFGFKNYTISISTKANSSDDYIGTEKEWDAATQYLKDALDSLDLAYSIKEGEAAFYGPKIEFNIQDSLKRNWQCGTIQVDFYMGDSLNLSYRNSENKMEKVIVIHRAILGSLERFIGILIEEYEGDFPLYLSPIQVRIIPIYKKEDIMMYIENIEKFLLKENIRIDIEKSDETLDYRIRKNELEKIPYLIIIGQKELESNSISFRKRKEKKTNVMQLETFKDYIKNQINVLK